MPTQDADHSPLTRHAWDLTSLGPRTPVCIRVGDKWPDAEGHILAYFVECVDWRSQVVLVWDLTSDTKFEAPIRTADRAEMNWTRRATVREEAGALDDLAMLLKHPVRGVRGIRRRS